MKKKILLLAVMILCFWGSGLFSQISVIASCTLAPNQKDTVCIGSLVTFSNTSSGANRYQWTFQGGSPGTSTLTNPTILYSLPGKYNVILTAYNDSVSQQHTVGVLGMIKVYENTFTVNFSVPTCSNCADGSATITTSPTYSYPPFTYSWNPNVSNSAVASNLSSGCYTVSVTNARGCNETDSPFCMGVAGIKNNSNIDENLFVYPNPAQGKLNILFDSYYSFKLFNSLGTVVATESNRTGTTILDISDYTKGVFILELSTKEGVACRKIIIQ